MRTSRANEGDVRMRRPEWLAERGGKVELLRLPALLFGAAAGLRARLYDKGVLPVAKLDVPVVSVGNLSTGGTGKTPFVAHVCRELRRRGRRPGILSRGYGSKDDSANEEARVLASELPDVPHVADPDRVRGGSKLLEESGCHRTTFGCCADGITAKLDAQGAGCDDDDTVGDGVIEETVRCENTLFGCCSDGITAADGPQQEGCQPRLVGGCAGTQHGCCEDGESYASGPGYAGCDVVSRAGCETSFYGCCPDGVTPADGLNLEGCDNVTLTVHECDTTLYGCCLDGQSVAAGPQFDGCVEGEGYIESCDDSAYGCCPDGVSAAAGPNAAGCQSRIAAGG